MPDKSVMPLLNKLQHTLQQPHPGYSSLRAYFRTVLGITIVVFFILSILQPFNIGQRNIHNNPYLTAIVYAGGAALTMCCSSIWMLLFPKWFAQWTFSKEMVVLTYQLLSIAATIWMINNFRGVLLPKDDTYSRSLFLAFAIGILPYGIATFVRRNRVLKHNLKEAEQINIQLKGIHQNNTKVSSAAQIPVINLHIPKLLNKITLDEFLFAESKGNNLMIQFIKNGALLSQTVRSTLNEFDQANRDVLQLFRCHRSFIINIDKILHIQGNAAGYQLSIHPQLPAIVVARSNVAAFKDLILSNKNTERPPLTF